MINRDGKGVTVTIKHTSINISLPVPMRVWVEETMARSGYGNLSEYMRHLIREDQRRESEAETECRLIEAMASPAEPMTDEQWVEIRRAVTRRRREAPNPPKR